MGKNCLSARGATSILKYIKENLGMGLEYIDLAVSYDYIACNGNAKCFVILLKCYHFKRS